MFHTEFISVFMIYIQNFNRQFVITIQLKATRRITQPALCEISSSRGGEYEAQNLLGCTAMFLIECQLT
jgi:hypothetical protein